MLNQSINQSVTPNFTWLHKPSVSVGSLTDMTTVCSMCGRVVCSVSWNRFGYRRNWVVLELTVALVLPTSWQRRMQRWVSCLNTGTVQSFT